MRVHQRGRMSITTLLVNVSWSLLVAMLLLAWFLGMLTMATAVALGAAVLEVYWDWSRRRREKRDAKRNAKARTSW